VIVFVGIVEGVRLLIVEFCCRNGVFVRGGICGQSLCEGFNLNVLIEVSLDRTLQLRFLHL
jgi:hypothetical protein